MGLRTGNALVKRLLHSAVDPGEALRVTCAVTRLVVEGVNMADGSVLPRLHAGDTAAACVFGGGYRASGMNLGPAMTTGLIAGRRAARDLP